MNQIINEIKQEMLSVLDNAQMEQLNKVLAHCFFKVTIVRSDEPIYQNEAESSTKLLDSFIAAKRVEGCSDKSLKYYRSTIENMLRSVQKSIRHIVTDDLRRYLNNYQQMNKPCKVTLDNIRRILSSFFSWLEEEDYIFKSPVRRIHKVKTGKTVKTTYTDEALEEMRDHCGSVRDLAVIDLLASTGMRVGELVRLDKEDIDFENRECVVFGKGDRERKVYFDARTKIHLKNYLLVPTESISVLTELPVHG